MKVLLINGSPNEYGCTYTALSEVAGKLQEHIIDIEILYLGNKPIAGCTACLECRETGKCIFDDQVNKVLDKLDEIDGLVIGSPVYFSGPNGNLTSFLDRLFFSAGPRMTGKLGASVVSCRRGGASASFDRLNKYFTIRSMPIVSSQYWNMVHGNTPEEVREDKEGMQTMRTLGENMAWLLKCINAGRKNGVPEPAYEAPENTNFIR
ncbi:MAG: flavodoxin family protein [Tindallia sp. MSAO_Bac2]|nr:MAG: flavodoxin family protein [Tindallia sp. MSAO_Bac2]